ncbi:hypothetical protein J437_LFUL006260 [Ladona fulva]|uniref:Protein amnionless n=1 Tax=Ladona fulva TaxID=123851 RepID=A0A8K0NZX4_LADFU|nr:hypothetical protein J437_LFUL006260 [Ladona fulva]
MPANNKRAIRIMSLYVNILIFLGVVAASYSLDRVKLWQGNTNFHNPINWNPPHVPCSASRVILPSDRKLVVMMAPETTVIREIVLPMNGEIILPSDGAIILDDKFSRNDNCKKEDVVYVGKKLSSWLDPNSWATRDNQAKDITVSAVPHAERIPCAHDKVVFPQGKSFRLLLPEVEVAVGSLSILGEI